MKNLIRLSVLIICGITVLFLLHQVITTKEGLSPSSNATDSSNKTDTQSSITNSSALDKFSKALEVAFSPPAAPAPIVVEQNWVGYNKANPKIRSSDSCSQPPQTALEILPIDKQSKDVIEKHSQTVKNILDQYDAKLTAIENILNSSDKILALNKKIGHVVNLGIPTAPVVYDSNSNSVINLSVVEGVKGDPGNKGDTLVGKQITGKRGGIGKPGIDPLPSNPEQLPYWSR
jgi:hypothetical protein